MAIFKYNVLFNIFSRALNVSSYKISASHRIFFIIIIISASNYRC